MKEHYLALKQAFMILFSSFIKIHLSHYHFILTTVLKGKCHAHTVVSKFNPRSPGLDTDAFYLSGSEIQMIGEER